MSTCNRNFVFYPTCREKATHWVHRHYVDGSDVISHECLRHAFEKRENVAVWATAPLKKAA